MPVFDAKTSNHRALATLDWLIVVGGVHGTHLAHVLVNALGVARNRLRLTDGEQIEADQIILATGFDPARPGHEWLDRAIAAHNLPCAPCGYPVARGGHCQRIARAVKRARFIALLPYTSEHIRTARKEE